MSKVILSDSVPLTRRMKLVMLFNTSSAHQHPSLQHSELLRSFQVVYDMVEQDGTGPLGWLACEVLAEKRMIDRYTRAQDKLCKKTAKTKTHTKRHI